MPIVYDKKSWKLIEDLMDKWGIKLEKRPGVSSGVKLIALDG